MSHDAQIAFVEPRRRLFARRMTAAAVFVTTALGSTALAQTVFYVKAGATGAGTGLDWTNAFPNLQAGLIAAAGVANGAGDTELWVAAGTYRPDLGPGITPGDRAATFMPATRVVIYGGFTGSETTRAQRNPSLNLTLLSGDLAGNDTEWDNPAVAPPSSWSENSLHIVTIPSSSTGVALDGVTITHGHANGVINTDERRGPAVLAQNGAAVILRNCRMMQNASLNQGALSTAASTAVIDGCLFQQNRAFEGACLRAGGGGTTITHSVFTRNVSTSGGGAILYSGSSSPMSIRGCQFTLNQAGNGGAILVFNKVDCVACDFQGNQASGNGGAIYGFEDALNLVNCRFLGNSTVGAGGAVRVPAGVTASGTRGNTTATNCIFVGNTAASGGALSIDSNHPLTTAVFRNCTMAENVATGTGGGIHCGANSTVPPSPSLVNCILWGNRDVGGVTASAQCAVTSGAPILTYSLIQGGWSGAGGTGVLAFDPQFKRIPFDGGDGWSDNPATPAIDESLNNDFGDLRPAFGSPAIDHGDNTAVPSDSLDVDNDGNTGEVLPMDLADRPRLVDVPCIADSGVGAAPQADIGAFEYAYNLAAAPVILVNPNAAGDGDGLTWATAVTDLQEAICAASASGGAISEIWVARGDHRPTARSDPADPRSARFVMADGTVIYGGFLGNEALKGDRDPTANVTVLSGDLDANDDDGSFPLGTSMDGNAYHVVNANGVDFTAELDGLIIRGGKAIDLADPLTTGNTRNQGGGLHTTTGSPTLTRCVFTRNVGLQGGGLFSGGQANPTISQCTIVNNAAVGAGADGGGLLTSSATAARPQITSCAFDSNTAIDGGGAIGVSNNAPLIGQSVFRLNRADRGGAIFALSASANPWIFACVFNGNQAVQLGGAFGVSGAGALICNSSFAGNTCIGVTNGQGFGGAIYSNAANATYVNCTLAGNVAGLAPGLTNGGQGGGLYLVGTPAATVVNTIVWGNSDRLGAGSAAQIKVASGSNPTVSYSDIQGEWAGSGTANLNIDPQFVTAPTPGPDGNWNNVGDDYGNLQLSGMSPCIDAGNDAAVPGDACDLDCDANTVESTPLDLARADRFIDTTGLPNPLPPLQQLVDIGAYEFGGAPRGRIYVRAGATGANNGSSWTDAFTELRAALADPSALCCEDTQVWVAVGTYRPAPAGGGRGATFQLLDGVEVLGGFSGTETQADQRDPTTNVTILSGDLNGDDPSTTDNAYHVVTGTGVTATAVLDGFTIRGGRADGSAGGGFTTVSAGPTLRNCRIESNMGDCAADLSANGGQITLSDTTLTSSVGGIGLSQSTVVLDGRLDLTAGRIDSFGNTVRGVGTLNLASGSGLRVRTGPPCGAELAVGAAGTMNATSFYTPNVVGPPAIPAQWNINAVPIHDVIITGGARRWIVAPSAQGAAATLSWSSPLLADLSSGGWAEATFQLGGTLQIFGDLYDASTSVPTPIVTSTLLLSANVAAFRVRETGAGTNALQFTQAPILLPTGGYLVANNLGFVLAGNQILGLGAALACTNTVVAFSSPLALAGGVPLTLTPVSPPQTQTILRSRVTGTGSILIDPGAELLVEGGALVDLSGQLPGQGCADISNAAGWGGLAVSGSLVVRDSTIQNSNVNVKIGSLEGATSILNNDCRLLSSVTGTAINPAFGGEFFVSGTSVVQCNVIASDGDRYLDLDPDPNAVPRPTLGQGPTGNKITVNIRQGSGLDQGELLELRSVDWDYATVGGGQSGAWQLAASAGDGASGGGGYTDTWVLEKLEVFDNAKVNLTNRQGFVFQNPAITIPEALYVKTIKLHPGAVLNTGLQRMYYQTLVDENNAPLVINPNDPHALLANGSRMIDIPLLGFSLKVIAMEDDTEFDVRLRKRLRDPADVQPVLPPFKEGEVIRVSAPTTVNPDNHAMALRTSKTNCPPGAPPCPSANSIAVHGAFARAGEVQIEVKFSYKFCGQLTDELIVYLSDIPEVASGGGTSAHLIEVARLYPPAAGPGSIGSSDFASFSGRFARGSLNFTRGTYVELELRGPNACALIDEFDPVVCLWCACGDFSGEGACGVETVDYLYLLSEFGNAVDDSNLCADQMDLDHYVDLSDLLNWSSEFHDPAVLNLCGGTGGTVGGGSIATATPNGLMVAAKPTGDHQNDSLYAVNPQTFVASAAAPAPVQNGGTRSGNGPLVRGKAGAMHQLHGVRGLVRLSDGQAVLSPKTFSNVSLPGVAAGSTVRVGLSSGGGYALLDAAFNPADPTGNTLFIMPVQVDPPGASGSGCPYRAAAKVQITSGGNFNLMAIYGANPVTGSTIVATGAGCDNLVFAPDASKMRELDVDAFGNLYVTSAQGVNDNQYILVYPISGGEIRVSLAGQLQAPAALYVSGDYLYVSTSLDGPDTTATVIHRYRIIRSGTSATGIDTSPSGHAIINIPGIRFLTGLFLNPGDGRLYAAGFNSTSCSRAACNADPSCPLGCAFNPGDPIFTTPMLASIANPTGTHPPNSPPVVTVTALTGTDSNPELRPGLPISLAISGPICGIGDLDGDGMTTVADIPLFIAALLSPNAPPANTLCAADINGDNALNGKDIQPFVMKAIGG